MSPRPGRTGNVDRARRSVSVALHQAILRRRPSVAPHPRSARRSVGWTSAKRAIGRPTLRVQHLRPRLGHPDDGSLRTSHGPQPLGSRPTPRGLAGDCHRQPARREPCVKSATGPGNRGPSSGGAEGTRTPDPHTARALHQVPTRTDPCHSGPAKARGCCSLLPVTGRAWTPRGHRPTTDELPDDAA